MAERACAHYGEMNRDLVLAGVLLHDLGKTAELTYQRSFGYSDAGNLIGHIAMEAEWINRALRADPGFPGRAAAPRPAHRPQPSWPAGIGSPVVPKTPEALLVHYLDDLDGKLEAMFRGIREDAGTSYWTPFSRTLDRMFYKPRWPPIPVPTRSYSAANARTRRRRAATLRPCSSRRRRCRRAGPGGRGRRSAAGASGYSRPPGARPRRR